MYYRHMGIKSVIVNSNKLIVSIDFNDVSLRERLKLVGFKWDRSGKYWYLLNDSEDYDLIVKSFDCLLLNHETPAVYSSDVVSQFLLPLWPGGGVLIQDTAKGIFETYEEASFQGCCDKLVIVCSGNTSKWDFLKDTDAVVISSLKIKDEIENCTGAFVVFDGVHRRNTKSFKSSCLLSLFSAFRVVLLDPYEINTIEDIQNAVLLAEPSLSPSYDFFKNHISVRKVSGKPYSGKSYKNTDEFVEKVSPIVRRNFRLKLPVPVPVKPKFREKALFERAKMRFTGMKSVKTAELALTDIRSASKYFKEEVPEDYLTAKQEKALEFAETGNFKIISGYDKEIDLSLPVNENAEKTLSLTVDPKCDFFLYSEGLEDGKVQKMFETLKIISKFTNLSD